MRKKILALFMSLMMMSGTLAGASVNTYATGDLDFAEEKVVVDSDALEEDVNSAWNQLEDYIRTAVFESEEEAEKALTINISKTEDAFAFDAEDERGLVELGLAEGNELAEAVYRYDDIKLKGEFVVNDFEGEIIWRGEDYSEVDDAELTDAATKLFIDAMLAWEDALTECGLSWADFGFDKWEEYKETIIEDNEEQLQEEEADLEDESSDEEITDEEEETEEVITDGEEETEDEEAIGDDEEEQPEDEELFEEENPSEEIDETLITLPYADRVELNYESVELKVGEKVKFVATIYPEHADETVFWNVSDPSYLSLGPNGEVTALKATGTADVYVIATTSLSLKEKKCKVNISNNTVPTELDEDGNDVFDETTGVIIADGIWVSGFAKTGFVYTGSAVKQNISIYNKSELLTLNKDYTLVYRNNINANTYDQINSPSVTVIMKGQYSGRKTLYYEIAPAAMSDVNIDTDDFGLAYTGKDQKYVPVVSFNGKRLANKKDFEITYISSDLKGNATAATTVDYQLSGKGNYIGNINGTYYIGGKSENVTKATVKYKAAITYDGTMACKTAIENGQALDLSLKLPGSTTVYYPATDSRFNVDVTLPLTGYIGTAKVTISGCAPYFYGTITKTFKINGAFNLAKVAEVNSNFKDEVLFRKNTNHNIQTEDVKLWTKDGHAELTPGVDYIEKVTNNTRVGVARVTYTGINAYTGTITKTFKLVNNSPTINYTFVETMVGYVQGGSKPKISLASDTVDAYGNPYSEPLVENVDYSVRYTNNNKVGVGEFKITFKGNYAKAAPMGGSFLIEQSEISVCNVTAPDKVFTGRAGAYKSTPVVTAPNGKRLVVGKDYEKEIKYEYDDWDITDNPPAGTLVSVTVKGMGNYKGEAKGWYRLYDNKTTGMNKLFISVDPQTYTGREIIPNIATDVHIYKSAIDMRNKVNEVPLPQDYIRIVSCKNNIKAGNATVVFGGAVNSGYGYGGTKTCTFKINKKNYDVNSVQSVSLDKTTITLTSKSSKATDTIVATVNPASATNKTLVWKSSNPNVVKITGISGGICDIEAAGNGTAVISCTSQDGSKIAKCTVKSIMKPLTSITLSAKYVGLTVSETYVLTYTAAPIDAYVEAFAWESSNTSVCTVDDNGKVTAVAPGVATVSIKAGTKVASCTVRVKAGGPMTYIDVTSSMYGAVSNDGIADNNAINKAIEKANTMPAGERNVYIPDGVYDINVMGWHARVDILGKNDIYIKMGPNAVLRAMASTQKGYQVINIQNSKNIIIEGGKVDGNKSMMSPPGGASCEYGNGIEIDNCQDVFVEGVTVYNCYGDGIFVGNDENASMASKNVFISSCEVYGCRRNNIALVNATDVSISDTVSRNAGGYAPSGLGFDIEPQKSAGNIVKRVVVTNCTFKDNAKSDFEVECGYKNPGCTETDDVLFDGCYFYGKIYINCGKNIRYTNTKRKPSGYWDDRNGSSVFPD